MIDKAHENMLRSLIEQVNSLQTTQFSGFGYWRRDYDTELTREDGPHFQLYAGLGLLVRDMYLYFEKYPDKDPGVFMKVISPIAIDSRQKYPQTTIFQPEGYEDLPKGFSEAAAAGQPTLAGLEDWQIVHEPITKSGKKSFNSFFNESRSQFAELCGPDGPYEQFRQNKVDENELGLSVAKVLLDESFPDRTLWYPLIAFLSVCAIKTQLETICEGKTIFFIAAEPIDASRLRSSVEFREIQEQLSKATKREQISLEIPQLSARPKDVTQALLDMEPDIVHFSGHGTKAGEICLEDETGRSHPVKPEALATLFEQFAGTIKCVILNACYSEPQANAIARHIDYVIGTKKEISDKAAITFAVGFYQALGAGHPVENAYKLGCAQLGLQNIPEHLTPVLVMKS